jgi:DNA topoisomerase-1
MQKIGYKTLLIVESPSKCKTIEKILGPAYMCVATCGHIRDLAIHSDLSNLPDVISSSSSSSWCPPYTKSSKKITHIRNIQTALSNCNGTVILATDADREGESIAWHVCQLFNLPVETTPRIVFKEITQSAIHTALKNPGRIDMNLVRAQQARQVIDFVIGYGVTPLLWKWMKSSPTSSSSSSSSSTKTKVVQSAGRCQTPALRILYDAHTEMARSIANPTVKYKCIAYFTKYDIPFSLTIQLNPQDIEGFLYFYTNVETRRMVASQHIFTRSDPTTVSYKPPSALKSTTLQQMGSSHLKLAPSETMNIAQRLYEAGYITYHRTESTCVSDEFKSSAHSFIRENWGDSYLVGNNSNSNSKSNSPSEFAHEAIRPSNVLITTLPTNDDLFGKNEQALYAFIWARAVCSCMTNSTYDKITANVNVVIGSGSGSGSGSSEYTYTRNEYRQKFPGWRACIARYGTKLLQQEKQQHAEDIDLEQDPNPDPDPVAGIDYFGYLQAIVSGSALPYNTIECCPRITNTVAPYTYARLIHKLEKMGIGRPSTFASIVHTLKKREYIQHVQHCVDSDSNQANQAINEHPRYFVSNYGDGAISTVTSALTPDTRRPKLRSTNSNNIQITLSGQRVIETLFPNCESLLAYNYTRDMEETLDEIALGNAGWVNACTECITQVNALKQKQVEKKNENEHRPEKQQDRENMNTDTKPGNGCIRTLNPYASIRDGKYGAYIFYKTPSMKKPNFVSLQGFPYTYTECDIELLLHWIEKHI